MRWYVSLLLLVLFVGCCAGQDFATSIGSEDSPRPEYAVYAALLKEIAIDKETTQIVIEENTEIKDLMGIDTKALLKELSPLRQEAISDFESKNKQPCRLTNEFNLKVKVILISKREIEEISENRIRDGWEVFHQKYPTAGAILTLSRVGFNEDGTQALIYVAYACGGLCGQGQYILLTKREAGWKVEKRLGTWIS